MCEEEVNEEEVVGESCEETSSAVLQPFYSIIDGRIQWTGSVRVPPTTSLMLQFDQVLTARVLTYHVDWLEECHLTKARSKWIYSILARIEKPLHQDSSAMIRQLYRRCSFLRSTLSIISEFFDQELACLNVLITISGSYFGQGEDYTAFNYRMETGELVVQDGQDGTGAIEGEDQSLSEVLDLRQNNDWELELDDDDDEEEEEEEEEEEGKEKGKEEEEEKKEKKEEEEDLEEGEEEEEEEEKGKEEEQLKEGVACYDSCGEEGEEGEEEENCDTSLRKKSRNGLAPS